MKSTIKLAVLAAALLSTTATAQGYKQCAGWDTFCKSPAQIVATKARLGVPVKHDQAALLGIPKHYMIRGGGNLVEGLPVTSMEKNISTTEILKQDIADHTAR